MYYVLNRNFLCMKISTYTNATITASPLLGWRKISFKNTLNLNDRIPNMLSTCYMPCLMCNQKFLQEMNFQGCVQQKGFIIFPDTTNEWSATNTNSLPKICQIKVQLTVDIHCSVSSVCKNCNCKLSTVNAQRKSTQTQIQQNHE